MCNLLTLAIKALKFLRPQVEHKCSVCSYYSFQLSIKMCFPRCHSTSYLINLCPEQSCPLFSVYSTPSVKPGRCWRGWFALRIEPHRGGAAEGKFPKAHGHTFSSWHKRPFSITQSWGLHSTPLTARCARAAHSLRNRSGREHRATQETFDYPGQTTGAFKYDQAS